MSVTQKNELIIGGGLQAFNGNEYSDEYMNTIDDGFIKIDNLPIKSEIKDLQCGDFHTIVLDYNGNIYGSGRNKSGQLGLGEPNKRLSTLTQLNIPFKVKKIAVMPHGTLLLNYHNELYGSGGNYVSQLGFSSKQNVLQETVYIYEFTKIIIDHACVDNNNYNICVENNSPLIIKKLFKSSWNLTVILTENDGFYFTGQNKKNGFRKLNEIKDYKNWKYNYAVLQLSSVITRASVYIFQTNYKINKKKYKYMLGIKSNKLLSDVVFNFN